MISHEKNASIHNIFARRWVFLVSFPEVTRGRKFVRLRLSRDTKMDIPRSVCVQLNVDEMQRHLHIDAQNSNIVMGFVCPFPHLRNPTEMWGRGFS